MEAEIGIAVEAAAQPEGGLDIGPGGQDDGPVDHGPLLGVRSAAQVGAAEAEDVFAIGGGGIRLGVPSAEQPAGGPAFEVVGEWQGERVVAVGVLGNLQVIDEPALAGSGAAVTGHAEAQFHIAEAFPW